MNLVTVSLSKTITLDTANVISGEQVIIRATALTGEWVAGDVGAQQGGRGFCAVRAYAGDVPFEIGRLKNPDAVVVRRGRPDFETSLYGLGNREPLVVWIADSTIAAESPL